MGTYRKRGSLRGTVNQIIDRGSPVQVSSLQDRKLLVLEGPRWHPAGVALDRKAGLGCATCLCKYWLHVECGPQDRDHPQLSIKK